MARTDHASMRRAFDALADGWDPAHGPGSPAAPVFAACLDHLRRVCAGRPRPRVLDIGCGTGLHLRHLGGLIAEGVGLDLSPRMIEHARAAAGEGAPLSFVVGAAEELTSAVPAGAGFDLVFVLGALEHMADPGRALREMAAVLAPGGEIVVVMRDPRGPAALLRRVIGPVSRIPPHRHLSPRSLARLAGRAGLRVAAASSLEGTARIYAAHMVPAA